jgi:hypothetical protein
MVEFIRHDPLATALLLQDQGVTTLEALQNRCNIVESGQREVTPVSRNKARTSQRGKQDDEGYLSRKFSPRKNTLPQCQNNTLVAHLVQTKKHHQERQIVV